MANEVSYSRLAATIEVLCEPFVHTNTYSPRDKAGKFKQVEIDRVIVHMDATGLPAATIWGSGHYLKADGTTGGKRASQVLMGWSELPEAVVLIINAEFKKLVAAANRVV